ncbi:MAG: hypothetical protein HXS40_06755 [Theionarchaea archaeon]|nr:hypothetical protein [Theionarchaea archaeon]
MERKTLRKRRSPTWEKLSTIWEYTSLILFLLMEIGIPVVFFMFIIYLQSMYT